MLGAHPERVASRANARVCAGRCGGFLTPACAFGAAGGRAKSQNRRTLQCAPVSLSKNPVTG